MSLFDKVLKDHEAQKAAKIAEERRKAASAFEKKKAFILGFRSEVARIAKPVFEQFAADAKRNGYLAGVEERMDVTEPSVTVRFLPVKNPESKDALAEEGSTFSLHCLPDELKVEYVSRYDGRPKRSGTKKDKFGLKSINRVAIEDHLGEFLKDSLKAREEG